LGRLVELRRRAERSWSWSWSELELGVGARAGTELRRGLERGAPGASARPGAAPRDHARAGGLRRAAGVGLGATGRGSLTVIVLLLVVLLLSLWRSRVLQLHPVRATRR
jgi:hypothetical protein